MMMQFLFIAERQPKRRESVLPTEKEKEEEKSPEPTNMFIIVKYADNQSLLVNPMCSVVNLLSSIKSRTGHAENKDMLLDLSDETGTGRTMISIIAKSSI